jgi:hypothetical protein
MGAELGIASPTDLAFTPDGQSLVVPQFAGVGMFDISGVPEPHMIGLFGVAVALLGSRRARRPLRGAPDLRNERTA